MQARAVLAARTANAAGAKAPANAKKPTDAKMGADAKAPAGAALPAEPICVTALAAAYVNGAAGVCRSAVFRPEWPGEPLWSPGCERLFAAALGNLLANAVQYGGERPFISVRAQKSGAMLLLTVADNGAGYAAPAAAANGLGLAVARQYAEAFGGRMLIHSAPGQGARFTLCLPLCAPGVQEAQNAPGAQGVQNAPGVQGVQNAPGAQGTQKAPGAQKTPCAPPLPPDYMADRFSPLYVQLAPVCDLPL